MNLKTSFLLGELEQKMSGYNMLLLYQYSMFCVKSDPISLLPVTVEPDLNIETVADITVLNENQLAVIPKDPSFLFPLCKAISFAHPEFKIEQLADPTNNEETTDSSEEKNDSLIICCTMPEVNNDRRDKGMDYVKVLYDKTLTRLKETKTAYEIKLTKQLGADPKALDEAKESIKENYDKYKELCDNYRKEKEEEIENAYQIYLAKETEIAKMANEEKAAKDPNAGKSMKLDPLATFE